VYSVDLNVILTQRRLQRQVQFPIFWELRLFEEVNKEAEEGRSLGHYSEGASLHLVWSVPY
jgi:hypothetical protein